MPSRSIIILIIGIVIALGTAWSLKQRMSGDKAAAATQVLIASTDIPAGAFVRADSHVAWAPWPKNNITESMYTDKTAKRADFEGAVARRAISKGEPITKNLLVKSTEGGFMSAVLEPGKRAVSIAVDPTSGNAGFIFPGDHVDLILTHGVDTDAQRMRASETFIEDVRVLAVDQRLDNPENKAMLAKTVTLEVTPKQAEEINVAKDLGKISLSLRSLASEPLSDSPAPNDMSFDDVLRQSGEIPTNSNVSVTRDTDVSRIISPGGMGAMRVRVIRGREQTEIDFSPMSQQGEPRAQ
jgi:pilus assembly protein CpaB